MDEATQTFARISLSSGGKQFLDNLERGEADLCTELLDRVQSYTLPFFDFTTLKLCHRDWRGNRSLSSQSNAAEAPPIPP